MCFLSPHEKVRLKVHIRSLVLQRGVVLSSKLGLREDFGLHYRLKLRDGRKAPWHISLNWVFRERMVSLVDDSL